jgi:hypothetical protein
VPAVACLRTGRKEDEHMPRASEDATRIQEGESTGRLLMMAQIAMAIGQERRPGPEKLDEPGAGEMEARVLLGPALNRIALAVADAIRLGPDEKTAFLAEAGCFDGD